MMGFKDVFLQHPERRYIMFGGGGGVGKTTFSAAAAYWLASHGKKVLVFSVDPQASLTDIFKRDIFGKGPVKIMENLWAQEIDADSHIRTYQQEVRQKILDMYGLPAVPEEIENYIQAASAEPAMEERGLRISWAMAAARRPTAERRSRMRTSRSRRRISVRSCSNGFPNPTICLLRPNCCPNSVALSRCGTSPARPRKKRHCRKIAPDATPGSRFSGTIMTSTAGA